LCVFHNAREPQKQMTTLNPLYTHAKDLELVNAALARDPTACRALIAQLAPVVRQRVSKMLLQSAGRSGRTPSPADVDDLAHDVFVVLFDREGRVLKAWDPTRGLSLRNFVGLVAQREASAILRSGRRSAWAEDPTPEDVQLGVEVHTPERQAAAREELALLLSCLRERLSPRGLLLFEALFCDHQAVEQVCERFDMTPNAIYSYRNRLQSLVAEFQVELRGRTSSMHSLKSTPLAAEPEPCESLSTRSVL
jgi:RNA polymerase sigma factor (sigma-70 family)